MFLAYIHIYNQLIHADDKHVGYKYVINIGVNRTTSVCTASHSHNINLRKIWKPVARRIGFHLQNLARSSVYVI